MGTDFSDLSPRGDEEKEDILSTENRFGITEPDRGDETLFGNRLIDLLFDFVNPFFWTLTLLPLYFIYNWLF